jgi:hypothetical protein
MPYSPKPIPATANQLNASRHDLRAACLATLPVDSGASLRVDGSQRNCFLYKTLTLKIPFWSRVAIADHCGFAVHSTRTI